jgi:hypothetical protein
MDFFGKYGLKAQAVLVRNNTMLTAGFASGDINMAYTGGTTVLGVAAVGGESKMVLGFVSRGRGFLMVSPIFASPPISPAKSLAQSIGGTFWMYAMLGLDNSASLSRATRFNSSWSAISADDAARWKVA